MLKRVQVTGYIEIPEGAELPELGEIVTISEFSAEVTGEGREKQQRRKDQTELVYTSKLRLPDTAQILKVEPAATPLFEGDGEDPEA